MLEKRKVWNIIYVITQILLRNGLNTKFEIEKLPKMILSNLSIYLWCPKNVILHFFINNYFFFSTVIHCRNKTHGNFCKTVKSRTLQYHLINTNTKFSFDTASIIISIKCSVCSKNLIWDSVFLPLAAHQNLQVWPVHMH